MPPGFTHLSLSASRLDADLRRLPDNYGKKEKEG
jgi:hypothetical protein